MNGGTLAAKRAPIAWRDQELEKTKALGIVEFADLQRRNNTSGVPGVVFLTPARQPEGIWQALLRLADGETVTKSFSVRRHGERRAFALAVAARRKMLADARDRPFLHDPMAKKVAANQRTSSR
jgi:hypothetical protein